MPEPPDTHKFEHAQNWGFREDGPCEVNSNTGPNIVPWAYIRWQYNGRWRDVDTDPRDWLKPGISEGTY